MVPATRKKHAAPKEGSRELAPWRRSDAERKRAAAQGAAAQAPSGGPEAASAGFQGWKPWRGVEILYRGRVRATARAAEGTTDDRGLDYHGRAPANKTSLFQAHPGQALRRFAPNISPRVGIPASVAGQGSEQLHQPLKLFPGGAATQAQTDDASRLFFGKPHGQKNMGWPHRPG